VQSYFVEPRGALAGPAGMKSLGTVRREPIILSLQGGCEGVVNSKPGSLFKRENLSTYDFPTCCRNPTGRRQTSHHPPPKAKSSENLRRFQRVGGKSSGIKNSLNLNPGSNTVTHGKCFKLPEPQFPHLLNGSNNSYLTW
jgi:hypothetical protein